MVKNTIFGIISSLKNTKNSSSTQTIYVFAMLKVGVLDVNVRTW